ncbi:hypothetical protein [Cohnella faecalis]|nr:hypothetical protein [Cohnella faecalis]
MERDNDFPVGFFRLAGGGRLGAGALSVDWSRQRLEQTRKIKPRG